MRETTSVLTVLFYNDPTTTNIYTLSLHDALPILPLIGGLGPAELVREAATLVMLLTVGILAGRNWRTRFGYSAIAFGVDRKSTRLNSSHSSISYAVFCLKKKTII